VADTRGLATQRENLQELGSSLIREYGYEGFLREVIAASHPASTVHLYDGIRHVPVLDAMDEVYGRVEVAWLEVPRGIRRQRWQSRERERIEGEHRTFDEVEGHEVERGVWDLTDRATVKIVATSSLEEVTGAISRYVDGPSGFTS
jgi:hypothetical protein